MSFFSVMSFVSSLFFTTLTIGDIDGLDCKYAVAETTSSVHLAVPLDVCSNNRGSNGNYLSSIWRCSNDHTSVIWTFYDSDDCTGSSDSINTYDIITENCDGTDDCSFRTRQYVSESGVFTCDTENDQYIEQIFIPTICTKADTISTMSWCNSNNTWSQAIYSSSDDCSGSFVTTTMNDGCIEGYTEDINGIEYDIPAYYNDVIYCNVAGYAPKNDSQRIKVIKSVYLLLFLSLLKYIMY